MPSRKPAASALAARLAVLAASADDAAFLDVALPLLASKQRLDREAAASALAARPLPATRDALRTLYFELDADGLKRDQGTTIRATIVRALTAIGDTRDADIARRASETSEIAFGEDIAWTLRALGLRLLAELSPDVFPYYAVERLDDNRGVGGEPANTAFRLLAATGNFVPLYQWLTQPDRDPAAAVQVFELFADAPAPIVERYARGAAGIALRRGDESMLTLLAEAIVEHEMDALYAELEATMSAKVSDALYGYLAVVLAGTNRPPLLAILDRQLHAGRPRLVLEALRIRTTPEQAAILERWEHGDD